MGVRTTNNMLINNLTYYIGNNLNRLDNYQQKLATGKKIQVPSDDPIVAARALKLRTDVAEIEQYKTNIKDAQSWMDVTEQTIGQIGDLFQRARELAVQTANSTYGSQDLLQTKEEISQLKEQVIHLANNTYSGRHIFSGFSTDSKLLDSDGNFNINVLNAEQIKYEIGIGDDINVNVPGGDLFNASTDAVTGTTGSVVTVFNDFINALTASDPAAIEDIVADIDSIHQNLLKVSADVGARMNRLDLTSNRLENDTVNLTKLMSENEDIDIAQTIMNLKNEENVYKASLAGGARVIMPTLLDFLR